MTAKIMYLFMMAAVTRNGCSWSLHGRMHTSNCVSRVGDIGGWCSLTGTILFIVITTTIVLHRIEMFIVCHNESQKSRTKEGV